MGSYGLLPLTAISTASPACRFHNPNTRHTNQLPKKHHPHVSCKATNGDTDLVIVDRRGMLLGLTGTAAATTAGGVALPRLARADDAAAADATEKPCSGKPIQLSDELYKCQEGKACFPLGSGVVDFQLPSPDDACRVRRPAHKADKEYVAKYAEAIKRQKELPEDDPRSFKSQAAVHDAFCNGFYRYTYVNDDGTEKEGGFNVHASWLFAPWHRMYTYFYERILGKLIDDDTFAMPFWNWDHPDGMGIPAMYTDPSSTLYNPNRDENHVNAYVELSYDKNNEHMVRLDADRTSRKTAVGRNLVAMYRQMITEDVDSPEAFHGERYCAGSKPSPGAGRLERGAHTSLHIWCGNKSLNGRDMGDLGTAGLDPLFYVHHANVDRMWHLWRHAFGNVDYTDPEWLDASFPFYDEEARLVRIRVRDVLDASALRYTYQPVDIPWLRANPKRSGKRLETPTTVPATARPPPPRFPVALEESLRFEVARPKPPRTAKKKLRPEELIVDGIEFDHCQYARFDVYVNVPLGEEGDLGPESSEFAGSFVNLPHSHERRQAVKTAVRLQLSQVLRDCGTAEDDTVFVTLVPRSPEVVTVGGARIEYLKKRPKGAPR